jgi:tRNA (guanine10-N2)-dimethyltransferase
MNFILRLSGEHPTLPKAELKAVLEGEFIGYNIVEYGRVAVIDTDDDDPDFLSRLAYTLTAAEYITESKNVDGLAADVFDSICDADSFRVTGPAEVQKRLGGLLHELGLEVDLKNPAAEVMVFEAGNRYLAGLSIDITRKYSQRRPQYRPYFHPTSMHPKLARALVNLTRVMDGECILDPFCGTGGILIEAGLMELNIEGWDIDPKMVEGCAQNLKEFGIEGDIKEMDALRGIGKFDAIATDPPYGRSSRPSEETGSLYRKFMENARNLLEEGSYLAVMLPDDKKIAHKGFKLRESYDMYIHKSLTRRIWVMEAV